MLGKHGYRVPAQAHHATHSSIFCAAAQYLTTGSLLHVFGLINGEAGGGERRKGRQVGPLQAFAANGLAHADKSRPARGTVGPGRDAAGVGVDSLFLQILVQHGVHLARKPQRLLRLLLHLQVERARLIDGPIQRFCGGGGGRRPGLAPSRLGGRIGSD